MKVKNSNFWKFVSNNYKTVKKWSKWKQLIIISAYTASTGKFIEK